MAKLPTIEQFAKQVSDLALDEFEYEGKTIREWTELILNGNLTEVVRCRDCKYWSDEDGELQRSDGVLFARCKVHNYLIDGRHTGWCPTENDFCSRGETRKDREYIDSEKKGGEEE